jgi:cupin fold WbuC family metalloprotein
MLALPNATGPQFTLTAELLAQGHAAAAASPRQRIILPLHRAQEAAVQRMINFLQPGTFVAPHLHPLPEASETIQVLSGCLGFLIFDEAGAVVSTYRLEAGPLGLIDIEPNVWHGFVVLAPDTAILEIKRGPYDGARDKILAPWAPMEGNAACAPLIEHWRQLSQFRNPAMA